MINKRIFRYFLIGIFISVNCLAADDIKEALKGGKTSVDLRYRFESVKQEDMDKTAAASTLRLRLGYSTGKFYGFGFHVDLETIQSICIDDYNSTSNGKTDFPVVADPSDTELNQAYLNFTGMSDSLLKLGRQRIKIDNARFIGNVGWRQNEQTYDAILFTNRSIPNLAITFSHIMNVNRIFGGHHPSRSDLDMNTNVINLKYEFSFGSMSAYGYFMDNQDSPDFSHQTLGLRFKGAHSFSSSIKALYTLEYAKQDEYKDGIDLIGASYKLVELGIGLKDFSLMGGYEVLGSKGDIGFATPLATLHAFNGWTDKFLSTPKNGLVDLYLSFNYKLLLNQRLMTVKVNFHKFDSDFRDISYGSELDLLLQYKLCDETSVFFKYAGYSADDFATDTTKFWAGVQFSF